MFWDVVLGETSPHYGMAGGIERFVLWLNSKCTELLCTAISCNALIHRRGTCTVILNGEKYTWRVFVPLYSAGIFTATDQRDCRLFFFNTKHVDNVDK